MVRYGTIRYGTVRCLPYLEIKLPNLEMAMDVARCEAMVAFSTLGAIWVGPTGCHWPTKCGVVTKNALLKCISIYGNSLLNFWVEIFSDLNSQDETSSIDLSYDI